MKRCPTCSSEFAEDALFCQWDGAPLSFEESLPDPYLGQVLMGQVEILGPVGQGGMGTVYRAVQRGFDRTVAVKILHPDLAKNSEVLGRFNREAKIAARLDHPNIVHVHLFGQLPDGNLFLVMEFLDGKSLLDVLRVDGALDVPRALHIAEQICSALGDAHEAGIIHRDLKPENIMLVRRGTDPDFVKVLDFGIAKFIKAEAPGDVHTQAGLVFGTARYISPEGASGDPVDSRSDVYSLGVVLYQMLCGEVPFHSDNPITLLLMHINEAPAPLRSHSRAADVHPAVEAVIMRALEKSPWQRYRDAREFGDALVEAAMHSGVMIARTAAAARRERVVSVAPQRAAAAVAPRPAAQDEEPVGIRTLEGPFGAAAANVEALAAAAAERGPSRQPLPAVATVPATGDHPAAFPATRMQPAVASGASFGSAPTLQATGEVPTQTPSVSMDAIELPSRRAPLVILVVVLLLVGGGAGAALYFRSQTAAPRSGDLVAAAEVALQAGRITSPERDGAADLVRRVLQIDPTNVTALDLRSRIVARLEHDADQARREGRLPAAKDALRLVLELDPTDESARADLQATESVLQAHVPGLPGSRGAGPAPVGDGGIASPAPPPAIIVSIAETAVVGRLVHLTARLSAGGPAPVLAEPHFHIRRRGAADRGIEVPATTGGDAGSFVATHAFARAGTFDVVFQANVPTDRRIEGRLTVAVHASGGGEIFTTGGGGAEVDPGQPPGPIGSDTAPPGPDPGADLGGPIPPDPAIGKRPGRRPPPPTPPPDQGGRWM
ncbi:MAG: protein kinase [Deltaproteobacteria bacterium]|nr:protein kinase [Deltaproteobacteria bacterium]